MSDITTEHLVESIKHLDLRWRFPSMRDAVWHEYVVEMARGAYGGDAEVWSVVRTDEAGDVTTFAVTVLIDCRQYRMTTMRSETWLDRVTADVTAQLTPALAVR